VRAEGADFGVAFDGDADRCFIVNEKGETIDGDVLAALIAKNVLEKEPGATIIYSAVCSKAFPELVRREGGKPVRTKAGHSIIKPQMRERDAAFGGEHSAHFYFRDNFFADSGIIAMLTVAELVGRQEGGISDLITPIDPYFRSGEINSEVEDQEATVQKVEAHFAEDEGVKIDHLDGLTVDFGDWVFNLRASNTEPLLRLNMEASDRETLESRPRRGSGAYAGYSFGRHLGMGAAQGTDAHATLSADERRRRRLRQARRTSRETTAKGRSRDTDRPKAWDLSLSLADDDEVAHLGDALDARGDLGGGLAGLLGGGGAAQLGDAVDNLDVDPGHGGGPRVLPDEGADTLLGLWLGLAHARDAAVVLADQGSRGGI
jgi:hypothetical protein